MSWNGVSNGLPLGLPGAVLPTRYVGGTTSGAPITGTFNRGDFVVNQDGGVYVCTVAGTPGTWVVVGGSAPVTSVFGRTGAVVAASNDYTAAQVTNAADKSSATTQTFTGVVASSNGMRVTGASTGMGYGTGSGGTVTQATSRSTAVTINKVNGTITTNTTSLASFAAVLFTVNNSTVSATDGILLTLQTVLAPTTVIYYFVMGVSNGSFQIYYANEGSGASTTAYVFNFQVIKGVNA